MSKNIIKYISILAVIGIIVFLIGQRVNWWQDEKQAQAENTQEQRALPVDAVVVQPVILQDKVNATGTLLAEESVELTTEASGRITQINFKEGQKVQKGELLLKIDDEELQAQLNKVTHQLELARTQEKRLKNLLDMEAVSQEEYDNAMTNLLSLKADSTLYRSQINKKEVRAPFSGVLGLRKVSPGAYVTANTPIASLVKIQPLKLQFSVPEKYVRKVNEGQKVNFSISADTTIRTATVYAFEPEIDPSTRSVLIRAKYPNKNEDLVPGFFADVEIILEEKENALKVPTQAIMPELGSIKVFRANNATAEAVTVKTGMRTNTHVEITEGIQQGDTILTTGMLQLRPGSPVNIQVKNGTQE
jgi:membrane fusion protein (multidrug efflux system)